MGSIDLPDVNVWIAMSAPDHVHRERAEQYWRDEAANQVAFSTITMLGLVRVSSTAPVFAGSPLSVASAWEIYLRWMQLPETLYAPEPNAFVPILSRFVSQGLVGSRGWTDAYLAAFALAGSMRVISFDRDFARFPGLDFHHLSL